jgi:hypothetical protein
LLNAELAPRLRSAGVDRWVRDRPRASDHAPTWIELDMGAKKKRSETVAQRGQAVEHSVKDYFGVPLCIWPTPVPTGPF